MTATKRRETQTARYEYRLSLPGGQWERAYPDEYNDRHCEGGAAHVTAAAKRLGIDFTSTVQRRRVLVKEVITTTETPEEWA